MSRRVSTTQGRKSRRKITLLWVAGLSAVIITLLVLEQTALLYVLATLGLTALLVVVALADLSGAHRSLAEPAPADDAAAIGTGISSNMAATTATATAAPRRPAPRATKRR
ncbi:MAG TPA: hypothetical protein VE842_01065 [Pyrinomonadaceae bacterium]|jgi:hypothetical protein|nr:hypothetical protein [Pyrinomonadaceae bacterium]